MVKKIKIKVKTPTKNINLPSIPISLMTFLVKTGSGFVRYTGDLDEQERKSVEQGLDIVGAILKGGKPIWEQLEPFTLVEVESEGNHVIIEMR